VAVDHKAVCRAYKAVPRRRVVDIAEEFGVTPQRVSAIAKANGLSREPLRRGVVVGKSSKYTEYGLSSLKQRNLVCLALLDPRPRTRREVAELLGMTERAVIRVDQKYGRASRRPRLTHKAAG
jgi:predicted transcriptional regulator